ncbi:hypothetical protein KC957_01060 [Candidatus Saccharibacteria bacterium]|nr:hypothetical protein [Candidatus Saccharibacteria bacterium]
MSHSTHETPSFAYGHHPEAAPGQTLPGEATPLGKLEDPYAQPVEGFEATENPFDQNPGLAMDMAVDQLFIAADARIAEQPLEDEEDLDSPVSSSGYDGIAVDIGTGSFLSVERLQKPDDNPNSLPRTVISKPVEKGTYNGVEYSQTERYIEGPDGKWHKEVDVDLGPGADAIFGTNKIHEQMPTDTTDMRAVHDTVYRPNNVRKLQRQRPQTKGSGDSLGQRIAA